VNGNASWLLSHRQPAFERPPVGHRQPELNGAIACPSRFKFDERVDIMNTTERQRLLSTMADAPTQALAVVLKCAVCLALLTLLVVVGGNRETDGVAPGARGSAPYAASAAELSGAATHRKEVFDERRARFAGNASERRVAETAPAADVEAHAP
jgi:hypothetical protein